MTQRQQIRIEKNRQETLCSKAAKTARLWAAKQESDKNKDKF